MNQNVLCEQSVTQNESTIDYQNKNQSALKISDDKMLKIIKEVYNQNFNDGKLKDGIGRLCTYSDTLFGLNIRTNLCYLTKKNIIELLFHYLMSLKVPPTEVFISEDYISINWYPTGKLAIKSNGEYIDLLVHFQKYIDSIKLIDLELNFSELNCPFDEECTSKEEPLPVEFKEETFSYYHGEEIMFLELFDNSREQYCYDTIQTERLSILVTSRLFKHLCII